MQLIAVVAMSDNRVIGKNHQLPWHMPADMRRFKALTMGRPILMGRRTYESLRRPLPGRCNVVITRDSLYQAPGCVVVTSIEAALAAVSYSEEIFVIGGQHLYQNTLHLIKRIYLTVIHGNFDGDTHFPELNMADWKEVEKVNHKADEENPYDYTFLTLDRI